MTSASILPGSTEAAVPKPCAACQHPRDSGGTATTVATSSLGKLRQGAHKGCITCGIFASAIQRLASGTKDADPDCDDDTRITFEFQMSYFGDSLAVHLPALELRISFFAVEG